MKTKWTEGKSFSKISKRVVSALASVALALPVFAFVNLTNAPRAFAVDSITDSILSSTTDVSDTNGGGTLECASSTACWTWDATNKILKIADDPAAIVNITATNLGGVKIVFGDGSAALMAAPTLPSLTLSSSAKVAAGTTLEITNGTLTVNGTIENFGTITATASTGTPGGLGGSGTIKNYNLGTIDSSATTGVTVASTLTVNNLTNTHDGKCDAPNASQASGAPHYATSTGFPADDVWCDVIVKLVVPETISLTIDNPDVTIPSPTLGTSPNGFAESKFDGLKATVSTNSTDGYQLMIRGISGQATGGDCDIFTTYLCTTAAAGAVMNKIAGTGFTVPDATAAASAAWGFRSIAGVVDDDLSDGVCQGRTLEETSPNNVVVDTSAYATNQGDCTSLSVVASDAQAPTYSTLANPTTATVNRGTWVPNSGDGAAATIAESGASGSSAKNFPASTPGATVYQKIPDVDTALTNATSPGGFGTGAFGAGDESKYTRPVNKAATWFRFGAAIKGSTASGDYRGKVRLTAVPRT